MKKILLFFILVLFLSILGCSNSITRAGETLSDMGKNYKQNRFARIYTEEIYQKNNLERIALLNDNSLSYGEKSLILEDMFNNFLLRLEYKGKKAVFKPVNGTDFCSTYSEDKGTTLYIPINAFTELSFDSLPFVTMSVIEGDEHTYYYLTEKKSLIKKIENPTGYLKNKYFYKNEPRAKEKEDINANTNEMISDMENKKIKISVDEIKSYLMKSE